MDIFLQSIHAAGFKKWIPGSPSVTQELIMFQLFFLLKFKKEL